MDSPDNLTVTPRGGLIACEDDASSAYVDTHPLAPGIEHVNRLIGLTQAGEAFELAVNVLNGSELAGACFSPSGPRSSSTCSAAHASTRARSNA
jgi:secreted PhoX family phosphatase